MPKSFRHRARAVALPSASAMASQFANADLADAYAIALPDTASDDAATLARGLLARPPVWVPALMAARDRIMPAFGVKTAATIRETGRRKGLGVIGSFPVRERTAREVVMGENDRHLDFSTSVLIRDIAGGREVVWVTAVHCRNRLGRIYLAIIAPFHRAIVRSYLTRAATLGWPTGKPVGY